MDLKNKKILVTGGAGFIGSSTVAALIKAGADVVIVDNLSAINKKSINPKARFYNLNVSGLDLNEVFKKEKPEIVYHFAFNVLVHKSLKETSVEESIEGGLNLLSNCQKHGVKKIIFSSSGAVYGNAKNLPTKETEPIDPAPYVVSKSAMENYIKTFHKTYGLKYVILRYATVYGPGQTMGAMSDYIRTLMSDKQVEIFGDGENTRDYVYIEDVVRANLLVMALDENFEDPIFNVSSGVETSLNKLYYDIANLLNKKARPNYFPNRPGELIRYCLDYSKIKSVLGWEPEYDLERGLKKRLKEENLI